MKIVNDRKNPATSSEVIDDLFKQPAVSNGPENIIHEIMSLSLEAKRQILKYPGNMDRAELVVEDLFEDIERIAGKDFVMSSGLASEDTNSSKFATIVADEMDLVMVAIEKCYEIIACSIEDKKYVFGLNASKELFFGIHQSCFWLKVLASQGCDEA